MGPLGLSIDVEFLFAPRGAIDGDADASFLNLLPSPEWVKLEGRCIYLCFIQVCTSQHVVSLVWAFHTSPFQK